MKILYWYYKKQFLVWKLVRKIKKFNKIKIVIKIREKKKC